MMDALQTAYAGFVNYIQQGKFLTLFIAAILWLLYRRRNEGGTHGRRDSFLLYAILAALCCICPLTAVVLMKYQTSLYRAYAWIFSAVPVTAIIAWGMTDFLAWLWSEKGAGKGARKEAADSADAKTLLALLVLAIVILSGNPTGERSLSTEEMVGTDGSGTAVLLDALAEEYGAEELCILGPKDVISAAHMRYSNVRTIYDRSIWEETLGSYSFDVHEDWQEDLYLWMNVIEETGWLPVAELTGGTEASDAVSESAPSSDEKYKLLIYEEWSEEAGIAASLKSDTAANLIALARNHGVNVLVLPQDAVSETVELLDELLGAGDVVGGYHVYKLQESGH